MNQNIMLHPELFSKPQKAPIRQGFGEGLLIAARADANVVGLCADLVESTHMSLFRKEFPERFIEMGVAEQNLAAVASGMAAMGKVPFITSYAMFSPGRNWEQIRTTIAYNHVHVVIAGSHAGVSVGPDGGTHQAIEDIALMRVIPRMIVISPCDVNEARKATVAAAKTSDPVYIRLAREKTPVILSGDTPFEIGKTYELYQGKGKKHATLFVTGGLAYQALLAAKKLEGKIAVRVVHVPTIKPLHTNEVVSHSSDADAIFTLEEHQMTGGLGSAIAETLAEHAPKKVIRIGIPDTFGQSGTPDELIAFFKLDQDSVAHTIEDTISKM